MTHPIVFYDIAGPDTETLRSFYSKVLALEIDALGRFEVPGQVVLGLFRDPAGNPLGLVEMEGETPKVP